MAGVGGAGAVKGRVTNCASLWDGVPGHGEHAGQTGQLGSPE